MVAEQDSQKETQAQTDFDDSHPEIEALDARHRDAASHLNERMGNNHRSTASERAEPDSAQLHGTQLTDNADQIDTDHANTDDTNHDDVNQKDRAQKTQSIDEHLDDLGDSEPWQDKHRHEESKN